jgi:alpha-beta hydrolase superfamily lysophospholipase
VRNRGERGGSDRVREASLLELEAPELYRTFVPQKRISYKCCRRIGGGRTLNEHLFVVQVLLRHPLPGGQRFEPGARGRIVLQAGRARALLQPEVERILQLLLVQALTGLRLARVVLSRGRNRPGDEEARGEQRAADGGVLRHGHRVHEIRAAPAGSLTAPHESGAHALRRGAALPLRYHREPSRARRSPTIRSAFTLIERGLPAGQGRRNGHRGSAIISREAAPRHKQQRNGHRMADDLIAANAGTGCWSAEYWASRAGLKLYVYRKRVKAPDSSDPPLPVLFLVHGSSASGRSSFDLQVPGRDYSLMDHFATLGYDVWTMDCAGYGRSDRAPDHSDISAGADDLAAAMAIVEGATGQGEVSLYGGSSGALRACLYAQRNPARVSRLIASALVYTGAGSPTLAKRRERVDEYRAHPRRRIDRDFIHSMFTRDRPGTSEKLAADALADAELALTDSVPTGTYLDMCTKLPVVDPARIECPVCIIRGEYDGIATEADLLDFFARLPSRDKQFVFISGLAHAATLGINRHKFWHAMHAFLTMPATRAIAG